MSHRSVDRREEWDALRNQMRALARAANGLYAGIPLPLEGHPLVLEPRYPGATEIMKMGVSNADDVEIPHYIQKRGSFWSSHLRSRVLIWSEHDKLRFGIEPGIHHISHDLRSMGASEAWGIEQEVNAVELLTHLISARQLKHYMLTGMFIETSRCSRVSYVFRRLRPTVALSTRGESLKILCALCLHPIGYYEGSFAGAMCPTDDVIAHLMLMRADERLFWARANQHPAGRPEAGL